MVVEQKVAAVAKKTVDLFEACLSDFADPQKVDGGEGVFDQVETGEAEVGFRIEDGRTYAVVAVQKIVDSEASVVSNWLIKQKSEKIV